MSFSPFNFVIPSCIRDALTPRKANNGVTVNNEKILQKHDINSNSRFPCHEKHTQEKKNMNDDASDGNSDDSSVSVSTSGVSSLLPHTERNQPSCLSHVSDQSTVKCATNPLKRLHDSSPQYSHKRQCLDKTLTPSQIFFGLPNYKIYHSALYQKSGKCIKTDPPTSETISNLNNSELNSSKNASSRYSHLKSAVKDISRSMEKFNSSSYLYGSYHSNLYSFKRGKSTQSTPPTRSPQLCRTQAKVSFQTVEHHLYSEPSSGSVKMAQNLNNVANHKDSTAQSSKQCQINDSTPDNSVVMKEQSITSKSNPRNETRSTGDALPDSPPIKFNFSQPLSASASSARLKDQIASTESSCSTNQSESMRKSQLISTGTCTDLSLLQRQDTVLLYESGVRKEEINKWLDSAKDASIPTPKLQSTAASLYSDDSPNSRSLKYPSKISPIGIRSSPSRLRVWRCETCLLENPITVLICPSCSTPKRLHTFSRCRVKTPAYSSPALPVISEKQLSSDNAYPGVTTSGSIPLTETVSVTKTQSVSPLLVSTSSSTSTENQIIKSAMFPSNSTLSVTEQPATTSSTITSTPSFSFPSGGFSFPSIPTLKLPTDNAVSSVSQPIINSSPQTISSITSNQTGPASAAFPTNQPVASSSFPSLSTNLSSQFPSNLPPQSKPSFPSPFAVSSNSSLSFPTLPQMSSASQSVAPTVSNTQSAVNQPFNFSGSSNASINFGTSTSISSLTPITSSQPALPSIFQFGSTKPTMAMSTQLSAAPVPNCTPAVVNNSRPFSQTGSMDSNDAPSAKMPAFSFGASKPQPQPISFNFGNSQSAPHLPALENSIPQITSQSQSNIFNAAAGNASTSRAIKKAKRRMRPN